MKPERHEKGWGYELWIVNNDLYCGKILHFNKGKKCSWHYHKIKQETFYVQKGKLKIWYGYDDDGASVHDVIGTRCDPYTSKLITGNNYHYCCHSNLTRALVKEIGIDINDAEKMRINSNGSMGFGTSSLASTYTFQGTTTADVVTIRTGSTANANVGALVFRDSGGDYCGQITCNGNSNSVSYVSSSDYRLKENVDYTWNATTRLKQLKPARFNWISDNTNTLVDGFLAHEVSSIVPNAVTGEKDAVYTEEEASSEMHIDAGDIKRQQLDHSKLVPLLVKTVQELEARIKVLEG